MKRKILWILSGLIFIYILTGISSKLFWRITTPQCVAELSTEEFLEDYNYFWEALEENYPLLSVVERTRNINIEDLKEKYRKKVETYDSLSMMGFHDMMNDLMMEMGRLGHLGIVDRTSYNDMLDTLNTMDSDRYSYMNEYESFLLDEKTIEVYQWLPSASQKNGLRSFLLGLQNRKNITFQEFGEDTSIMKIRSFSTKNMEKDRIEIEKWVREHPDHTNLVIDLRSNPGGNGYYWMDNLVSLFSEKIYTSESFYFASAGPDFARIYGGNEDSAEEDRQKILALPEIKEEEVRHLNLYKNVLEIAPSGELENNYQKRYVLTDKYTGSAAGQFSMFCKNSGWATLVGERTYPDFDGLTPIWNQLPNSKLIFQYRVTYSIHPDGSCGQEKGVMPDIYTPDDALDACLDRIEVLR